MLFFVGWNCGCFWDIKECMQGAEQVLGFWDLKWR